MTRVLLYITAALFLTACGGKNKKTDQAAPEPAKPPVSAHPPSPTPGPQPVIDKLNLRALPTVINLDDDPSPEGVQVELFLFRLDTPLALALEQGVIEFLVYENRVSAIELDLVKPLRAWPYPADELARFGTKTAFGSGYGLVLRWDDTQPKSSSVTLSARLLRPGSKPLYAQPLYLATGPK